MANTHCVLFGPMTADAFSRVADISEPIDAAIAIGLNEGSEKELEQLGLWFARSRGGWHIRGLQEMCGKAGKMNFLILGTMLRDIPPKKSAAWQYGLDQGGGA